MEQELQVELAYAAAANPILAYVPAQTHDVTQFLSEIAGLPALKRLSVYAVRRTVTLDLAEHARLEHLSLYCQHLNISNAGAFSEPSPELIGLHLVYETAPKETVITFAHACSLTICAQCMHDP